jgi:hypothetical protein
MCTYRPFILHLQKKSMGIETKVVYLEQGWTETSYWRVEGMNEPKHLLYL